MNAICCMGPGVQRRVVIKSEQKFSQILDKINFFFISYGSFSIGQTWKVDLEAMISSGVCFSVISYKWCLKYVSR